MSSETDSHLGSDRSSSRTADGSAIDAWQLRSNYAEYRFERSYDY